MTCCGDLEHNQAFLVQTFFAQSHKPEQHTKLRGPNHQICGPKSSIVSHVKTVQIAGVKSNFTGSKNEVWVQNIKFAKLWGDKSHFAASKNEAWVKISNLRWSKSSKLSRLGAQNCSICIRSKSPICKQSNSQGQKTTKNALAGN